MSKEVNLMQMPTLNNQSGFRLHDLSHYFAFKCSTGHIVDLVHDVLNPGERISLHPEVVVQMNPLVSPAMVDIDCDIHYFFVPMDMLDMGFGRKWSQTVEHFSSLMVYQSGSNTTDLACFSPLSDLLPMRKYIHSDIRPELQSNEQESLGSRVFRNLDYMGLNPFMAFRGVITLSNAVYDSGSPRTSDDRYETAFSPYSFYYSILAYNAIWQYWYRLEDRDRFNSELFNVDHLYKTGSFGNIQAVDLFGEHETGEAFAIKYAPRKKDYFTSTFKAPVINGLNFLDSGLDRKNDQYLLPSSLDSYDYGYSDIRGDSSFFKQSVVGSVLSESVDASGINTQQIRIMQAKEKYLNILGRLPRKNYDNLAYALFGDKIPHDVKHELSHLGHDHFTINISRVTSFADTGEQGGAPLGELAGQGFGSSSQRGASSRGVKFKAPCHGVVMALLSIVPNYMYYGIIQRHNYIGSMNDFYNPVYDNLGMQPVYAYELGVGGILQNDGADFSINETAPVGWQFMYTQWKMRPNRLGMAFSEGNEKAWFNSKSALGLNGVGTDITDLGGSLHNDADIIYNSLSNSFFYCSPNSLNEIMGFQYTTEWQENWLTSEQQAAGVKQADLENWYLHPWQIYARDPFICLSRINYKKFSKMSSYSLVQFD